MRAEQSDANNNVGTSPAVTFSVSRASATATSRQAILDDDPAAYWRLRETAGIAIADRGPNNNTGTALNGAGLGAAGAIIGDPSAGVSLDGVDDEINMGDPASGALDLGTDDFTIEMWMRTTSAATQGVLAKQPSSGGPLWQLLVTSAPGFVGHVRATFNDGTTQRQGYSPERVDDGQWHYVAVTVDRDIGMTIYVDDDSAIRNGALPRTLDNSAALQIGRVTGFPSLNGSIDDVAIYRRALSAAQTLGHYREGTRLEPTTPAPTLTAPAAGSRTTDATPAYTGRAGIARGDANPIALKVYGGTSASGSPVQTTELGVEPSGEYSLEPGSALAAGTYTAQVEQRDTAGQVGRSAAVTFTIDPPVPPSPADPALIAAGDIAYCSSTGDEATANLLDTMSGTIQTLGDNAYESGTTAEFNNCYAPTWGRHKARTRPAVGDHEYLTSKATPYFNYFGAAAGDPAKGYYSYDIGAWHVVVMNAVCDQVTGGCDPGSPQEQWVRADLAAHPSRCAIGVISEPRYSSGSVHGAGGGMQPLWQALYDNGVDVVLNGDDHVYERFAPMTPDGRLDRVRGMRQFTVGTGGRSHYAFGPRQLNSEAGDDATYGVLRLGLHPTSYDWEFVPVTGSTFTDLGTRTCGA